MASKRTHIRASSVGTQTVLFEIPEWKPDFWFELPIACVPFPERSYLHPGFRCCVTIDIDAQSVDQLNIRKWALY